MAHAELFLRIANAQGFTNTKTLQEVGSEAACAADELMQVTEYLDFHLASYVKHLYQYRDVLVRSQPGRIVLTGGRGWDPLRDGSLVQCGQLPPCFAPSREDMDDEVTAYAAVAAGLMRMPNAEKFSRGSWWHIKHVLEDAHSNPECKQYHSRMSVEECKQVCAECRRWLGYYSTSARACGPIGFVATWSLICCCPTGQRRGGRSSRRGSKRGS